MSFIVIEGLDGSGKGTQSELLYKTLLEKYTNVKKISFPDYDSPSSSLVKMYLGGEFGTKPGDVNAYAASTFYAVDRFASYKKDWGNALAEGTHIIADRYTTANLIYQLSKLPEEEWNTFAEWLIELEWVKMGLPKPDAVIYLDMLPEVSQKLLSSRYSGDDNKKDIHEKDVAYLKKCRDAAHFASEKFGWKIIRCDDGEKPFSIESIHQNIMSEINI